MERKWYQQYAHHTNIHCRVPQSYHAVEVGTALLLIMEDLDASGYAIRQDPETVTLAHAKGCLTWLAYFHARFMDAAPEGLWPVGTYWHLETRQDEWERMENIPAY